MPVAGGDQTLLLFESTLLYVPAIPQPGKPGPAGTLIPERALTPGEQYRFHFDMTKCIGCKCCVVACNEQNGNPAAINWRRVGEVEGGHYPYTQRYHLSMGCNHCLEPSCMTGCPVEAYSKNAATGVVTLNSDTCIGCQYCTWNCSYGVPQYNPERGVAGKCDMCHERLSDGMAPACVAACPEEAIAIEIVDIAEWRQNYLKPMRPACLPRPTASPLHASPCRRTCSPIPDASIPRGSRPEHPHWPLVVMLVLTQFRSARSRSSGCSICGQECPPVDLGAVSLALAGVSLAHPLCIWAGPSMRGGRCAGCAVRGSAVKSWVFRPSLEWPRSMRQSCSCTCPADPGRAAHRAVRRRWRPLLGADLPGARAPGMVQPLHGRRVLCHRAAAGPLFVRAMDVSRPAP